MLGTILGGALQYNDLRSNVGAANYSNAATDPTVRLGDIMTNNNYTIYKQGGKFRLKDNHTPWLAGKWR